MAGIDEVVLDELKVLRKGPGAHAPKLDARIGPNLRKLAAKAPDFTALDRETLLIALTVCAARMPVESGRAALAGLAILRATRETKLFDDRVRWLAKESGFSFRTAKRRVDDATLRLAEEIARELSMREEVPGTKPSGWILTELKTLFRLDTATPVAQEDRRILATRDGLTEIRAWWDIPAEAAGRPGIVPEVLYGGQLVRHQEPGQHRLELFVELPRALSTGEEHQFGVALRVVDGAAIRPHYIFTPEMQCDLFQLRVRFAMQRLPRWVRVVRAETVREFDAEQFDPDVIKPDGAGEIALSFTKPKLYLGYGAQWRF